MIKEKTSRNWGQTLKRIFMEDQYHLGSISLSNPKKNHYIIGFFPKTTIEGDAKGKIRTIGISARSESEGKTTIRDNASYGIIANTNTYGDSCKIDKSKAIGLLCNSNQYGMNCIIGSTTSGGIINMNVYDTNCIVGNSKAIGIINSNESKLENDKVRIIESCKSLGPISMTRTDGNYKFGLLERSIINQD